MADRCDHCLRDEDELEELELSLESVCEECAEDGVNGLHEALKAENATLRARVAELEQAHAEQVAEREHLEEAALTLSACIEAWGVERFPWETRGWLEAERARQAKGDKREGSG